MIEAGDGHLPLRFWFVRVGSSKRERIRKRFSQDPEMPRHNDIQDKKVNLGCGGHAVDAWINVDYALGARLLKVPVLRWLNKKFGFIGTDWSEDILIHDVRKSLPFGNNSIGVIYTSHLLEHLTREEGEGLFLECWRVLIKGGILRVVVPDLESFVQQYRKGVIKADEFVDKLGVLPKEDFMSLLPQYVYEQVSFPHKCMYDTDTLLRKLRGVGFDAQAKEPFESEIADIGNVEQKQRTSRAVIVEAVK